MSVSFQCICICVFGFYVTGSPFFAWCILKAKHSFRFLLRVLCMPKCRVDVGIVFVFPQCVVFGGLMLLVCFHTVHSLWWFNVVSLFSYSACSLVV